MQFLRLSTPNKEEEENEEATMDDTSKRSIHQMDGVIGVKPEPTLPSTAEVRKTTNKLEIRMIATTAEKKDI